MYCRVGTHADKGGVHPTELALLNRVLCPGGQINGHLVTRQRADHRWRLHSLEDPFEFREEMIDLVINRTILRRND